MKTTNLLFFRAVAYFLLNFVFSSKSNAVIGMKSKITWVNGIGHNTEHMEDGIDRMSALFGGKKIDACHNPTAMINEDDYLGFIGDLTQAGTQKLGRITGEVNQLVRHLKNALQEVGSKGRVVHIAHSQGVLITALAARKLKASELSQIEVVCFGGAATLHRTKECPFHRVVNYYAVNDPLLHVVPTAVKALRSGFLLSSYQTNIEGGGEPEFVFLSPRSGDPVLDHYLFGPTYELALEWEGKRFQKLYITASSRICRTVALAIAKVMARITNLLKKLMECIYRTTMSPLFAQIKKFYTWQAEVLIGLRMLMVSRLIKPIVVFFHVLSTIIRELIVWYKEGNEQYEPIEKIL